MLPLLPLLLDCTLKATLLLLAAFTLSLALRKSSAARRHLLWATVLLALLALPLLTQLLPPWQILPQINRTRSVSEGPIDNRHPNQPLPTPPLPTPLAHTPLAHTPSAYQPPTPQPASPLPPAPAKSLTPAPFIVHRSSFPLLPTLYLTGLALSLLPFLISLITLLRLQKTTPKLTTPDWSHLLAELSAQLAITRPVTLLQSKTRIMPMTWSLPRPYILLPQDAPTWSDDRRRCVLLHELAHLRRRDTLTLLLARFVCCLYWFHPLVWLAAAQLRNLAEHAADDLVLSQNTKSSTYAQELLVLASTSRLPRSAAAIAMAHRPSQLKLRIHSILNPLQNRKSLTTLSLSITLLATAALLFPIACAHEREATSQSTPNNAAFPHLVPFALGQSQFLPGDNITITDIHGTADTITPGNTYQIKGTYTLASRDHAQLAAYITAPLTADSHTPHEPRRAILIDKGSGTFSVVLPFLSEGSPHLSFYPTADDHSTGGSSFSALYFKNAASKSAAVDLGKENLKVTLHENDDAKPGLYAVGIYPRTIMPPLPTLYQSAANGKIPKGASELIGRLPEPYPANETFEVESFQRVGHSIAATVRCISEGDPKTPGTHPAYLSTGLPADLQPGHYRVIIVFEDYKRDHGVLYPLRLVTAYLIYIDCEFDVPGPAISPVTNETAPSDITPQIVGCWYISGETILQHDMQAAGVATISDATKAKLTPLAQLVGTQFRIFVTSDGKWEFQSTLDGRIEPNERTILTTLLGRPCTDEEFAHKKFPNDPKNPATGTWRRENDKVDHDFGGSGIDGTHPAMADDLSPLTHTGSVTFDRNTMQWADKDSKTAMVFTFAGRYKHDPDPQYQYKGDGVWGFDPPKSTTQPATTQPSTGNRDGPDWSKESNGLRVRLAVYGANSARTGVQAQLYFWNVSDKDFALNLADETLRTWEVRDAAGKVVEAKKSRAAAAGAAWCAYTPALSPQSVSVTVGKNVGGQFEFDGSTWQLSPGKYTIRGTFRGPSKAPGKPAGVPAWQGNADVPAQSFEVIAELTPEEFKVAIAKVNAAHHANAEAKWKALAELVTPGMDMNQMKQALPVWSSPNEPTELTTTSGGWVDWYRVDADFVVEAVGGYQNATSTTDISPTMVLMARPKLMAVKDTIFRKQPPGGPPPGTQPATQPAAVAARIELELKPQPTPSAHTTLPQPATQPSATAPSPARTAPESSATNSADIHSIIAKVINPRLKVQERLALFQSLYKLPDKQLREALWQLALEKDDEYASVSAVELVRMNEPEVGRKILPHFEKWSSEAQDRLLQALAGVPAYCRSDASLLDLPRALLANPDASPHPARADPAWPAGSADPAGAAATILGNSGTDSDKALLRQLATRRPDCVRAWLSLAQLSAMNNDCLSVAQDVYKSEKSDFPLKIAASIAAASKGDKDASAFALAQIEYVEDRYANVGDEDIGKMFAQSGKSREGAAKLQAYFQQIGVLNWLRLLDSPDAPKLIKKGLASKNMYVRLGAGIAAAKRWPQLLTEHGRYALTNDDDAMLLAMVVYCHPELRQLAETKVDSKKLEIEIKKIENIGVEGLYGPPGAGISF